jgi:hypothetical protein
MIKAIVYKTNTGFTQRYAQMLAQKLNVECLDLDSAKLKLNKGDAVLFMGWFRLAGSTDVKRQGVAMMCALLRLWVCPALLRKILIRSKP